MIAARLTDSGSGLVYSTYIGGSDNDYGYGAASVLIGGNTHTYVAGTTASTDYPLANPYQATNHGQSDGFISEINEQAIAPSPTATASPSPTATPRALQFEDVPPGSTFYPYIQCLACRGIINGYPCGGVASLATPITTLTSAQATTSQGASSRRSLPTRRASMSRRAHSNTRTCRRGRPSTTISGA